MDKIASFQIDHNKLKPGIYLSRADGDIFTYDLRFVKPNTPPFLETAAMHTIEHLFATMARNSGLKDNVVYFGPMGCRTGFYFLLRGTTHEQAIALIQEIIRSIAAYEGEIPGTSAAECGNCLEHNLSLAKEYAKGYYEVIHGWDPAGLKYQV